MRERRLRHRLAAFALFISVVTFFFYVVMWNLEFSSWSDGDVLILAPSTLLNGADIAFSVSLLILSFIFGICLPGWWKLIFIFPILFWFFVEITFVYLGGRFGVSEQVRLSLEDGREFMLTKGRSSRGVLIYEHMGQDIWRSVLPDLEYSIMDGPPENYQLWHTQDEAKLIVQRGELATDCVDISSAPLKLCANLASQAHPASGDGVGWTERSASIFKGLDGAPEGID